MKGLIKYLRSKGKTRQSVGLVLNEVDTLVTKDAEKAGLPNVFFISVFTPKASSQESQILVVREKVWRKGRLSLGLGV